MQVLISAGFDAVDGDPLGECSVSPLAFGHMTRLLACLGRPIVLLLEGGYNLLQTALATEQARLWGGEGGGTDAEGRG